MSVWYELTKSSICRVNLPNGGYLVLEETEALVSIDVNGGTGMLAHDISQGEAILEVNLAAARQVGGFLGPYEGEICTAIKSSKLL